MLMNVRDLRLSPPRRCSPRPRPRPPPTCSRSRSASAATGTPSISHLGEKAGIFKKYGIKLEIIYTAGAGETLQPVIAGTADLGVDVGTQGVPGRLAKGAPVRIIGAEATGAADYWYAKASSPIKTLKDTNGRTIAYSTQGSSTHSIVRAFIDEFKLAPSRRRPAQSRRR